MKEKEPGGWAPFGAHEKDKERAVAEREQENGGEFAFR